MIISSFSDLKIVKKFFLEKNFKKTLIITGKNSYFKSNANKLLNNILPNNLKKFYYFKKNYYPDLIELHQIIKKVNSIKPDIILAVGGGCVIDYAKLANVFFNIKNISYKVKNSRFDFNKKFCELIAIPTTAGSGAEVTPFAVLYINKVKYSVENKLIKPDEFIISPNLVIGSNKILKASTGFDAIAQALESMISVKSNSASLEYSKKSLELSIPNFINYLNNPNKDNSLKMNIAANLAGKAISIAKTNGPHATSYPFTTEFGINHGHAVSLTLNKFMCLHYIYHFKSVAPFDLKKRFHKIFQILKVKNIYEFDLLIKNIKKKANLEDNFNKLGINIVSDYHKIIRGVNIQRLNNCPIKITKQDIRDILLMDI